MKKILAVALLLTMALTMALTAAYAEDTEGVKPQLLSYRFRFESDPDLWESMDRAIDRVFEAVGYVPKYTVFEADRWFELNLLDTVVCGPCAWINGKPFIPVLEQEEWETILALNRVPDPNPKELDSEGFINVDALWDENFYPKDYEFHERKSETYWVVTVRSEIEDKYFEIQIPGEPITDGAIWLSPEDWAQAWYDVHF